MSVTGGFFNSVNGDRTYDAEDMNSILSGVITEGVYSTIGDRFNVTANGSGVNVGSGRAWLFDHWIYNDSIFSIPDGSDQPSTSSTTVHDDVPPAHPSLNRYDAVIISVSTATSNRYCKLMIATGIPSSSTNPAKPGMADSSTVRHYPVAYIYRPAGTNAITASRISYNVGNDSLPWAKVAGEEFLTSSDIDAICM